MAIRAVAEVNLAALERNVARLRSILTGEAKLWATVKADGYGHGALPSADAALGAGAAGLAVATSAEAAELRAQGVAATILVMGAISRDELQDGVAAGAETVAWDTSFVNALSRAANHAGKRLRVHVKLDTGLGRLGTRDPKAALEVAQAVKAAPGLELAGAMTHFATADEDLDFARAQLESFRRFLAQLRAIEPRVIAHAANSAATLRMPESHLDAVRCGIAIYGCDPMHENAEAQQLEPVLALRSYVAALKPCAPGQSAGYGRHFRATEHTWLATVPIGYGDGIPRRLTNNCEVSIGGHRYPLVGMVSMDNITIDAGPAPRVSVGDSVTILGQDGPACVCAEELARRLDTITYEVLCGISRRVPRLYHRDGASV